jgi:hypothetical protein
VALNLSTLQAALLAILVVSCKEEHPPLAHTKAPSKSISIATQQAVDAHRIASGIPRLALIEQATREYLLLVQIEVTVPKSDWAITQEAEKARARSQKIIPKFEPEAPLLIQAEVALLNLSGDLARACSAVGRQSITGRELSELRRRVRSLLADVHLAVLVLTDPQFVNSSEFYDPQILTTLGEITSDLREIEKRENKTQIATPRKFCD